MNAFQEGLQEQHNQAPKKCTYYKPVPGTSSRGTRLGSRCMVQQEKQQPGASGAGRRAFRGDGSENSSCSVYSLNRYSCFIMDASAACAAQARRQRTQQLIKQGPLEHHHQQQRQQLQQRRSSLAINTTGRPVEENFQWFPPGFAPAQHPRGYHSVSALSLGHMCVGAAAATGRH
jgi:hypothetical protein